MAYTVVRVVKGKRYLYRQTSYRVGKKVKTKSVYLGRIGNAIVGVLAFAAHLAKNGVEAEAPHKARSYTSRGEKSARDQMRANDRKYGLDKSNRDAFHASLSRLSPEMRREHFRQELAIGRQVAEDKERAREAKMTEAEKADRAEQVAAIQSFGKEVPAPEAPGASKSGVS